MTYELKKLIDVAEIISGGTPQSSNPNYFGGDTVWLTPKDLSNHPDIYIENSERTLTAEGIKNSSAKLIPEGSVTLSSRAPIGYVAIPTKPFTTNQGMKSFVPKKDLYNEYLYYYLLYSRSALEKRGSGTTFKEISKSKLEDFQIPIPTLQEQKQIVSKIKECFNYLDNAEEKLKQAEEKLDKVMDSIYNKEIPNPTNSNNYKIVKLAEITEKITDGSHNPPTKQKEGKLMLSAINIENDFLNKDSNVRFIDEESYAKEVKRSGVKKDDVLLTAVGTIGRTLVVNDFTDFVLQRSVTLIRLKDPSISQYISYYLRTPFMQRFFLENAKGTAQKGVYLNTIKQIEVVLPEPEKIYEIIAKIDNVRKSLELNIKLLKDTRERIKVERQSILKKAFEGKLI